MAAASCPDHQRLVVNGRNFGANGTSAVACFSGSPRTTRRSCFQRAGSRVDDGDAPRIDNGRTGSVRSARGGASVAPRRRRKASPASRLLQRRRKASPASRLLRRRPRHRLRAGSYDGDQGIACEQAPTTETKASPASRLLRRRREGRRMCADYTEVVPRAVRFAGQPRRMAIRAGSVTGPAWSAGWTLVSCRPSRGWSSSHLTATGRAAFAADSDP